MAGATKAPKTADGRSPKPGQPEPGGPAALAARLARLLLGPWLKPPGDPKARDAEGKKGKGA